MGVFPCRCVRDCKVGLTHCVMAWIVLTVLCGPVRSDVTVTQPYSVVSTNGTAKVLCYIHPQPYSNQMQPSEDQTLLYPYPNPEEYSVTLLKGLQGSQEVCSSSLSSTETEVDADTEVQCSAQLREGAVEMTVSGLKANDTDIYRCVIVIYYPPPYLRLTGNGTLIHVLESSDCPGPNAQRQTAHHEGDADERTPPVSVPVVVLVILVMFVLIIIIYFQTLQCIQGRMETARLSAHGVLHKADAAAFSC